MPIGTSKIGVLGGKIPVPAGSQTFNSPGTFTAVTGLQKVTINGTGGAGTGGTAGNSGNNGAGGGGGPGGGAGLYNWCVVCYCGCAFGSYYGYPPCVGPSPGGTAYPGNSTSGASGNSGTGGNAGASGASSTGLSKTFPGGAAGNPGNAGTGGSGGGVGGTGGNSYIYQGGPTPGQFKLGYAGNPGTSGGGIGGEGATPNNPYGGGFPRVATGGGGAGATNSGNAGMNMNQLPTFNCPGQNPPFSKTGGSGGNGPTGSGGPGGNMVYPGPSPAIANPGGHSNCLRGGGGGGVGADGQGPQAAGGGGGGRGNAGNAGSSGNAGAAGTPATYNCVSVTPGGTYPIVVGSGGQINISWNKQ